LVGKVTVWQMTEEQRLEYIKKHPINSTANEAKQSSTIFRIDYNWRGKKAANNRKNKLN
jgi:ribosome recycling factor